MSNIIIISESTRLTGMSLKVKKYIEDYGYQVDLEPLMRMNKLPKTISFIDIIEANFIIFNQFWNGNLLYKRTIEVQEIPRILRCFYRKTSKPNISYETRRK